MKDHAAAPAQNVGSELANGEGKTYNHIRSGCMYVGLNSRQAPSGKIPLSIAIEAIVCFGSEPAVDVIAVSKKKPARVGRRPGNSLAVTILGEKTCALQTDLRAAFLSRGSQS